MSNGHFTVYAQGVGHFSYKFHGDQQHVSPPRVAKQGQAHLGLVSGPAVPDDQLAVEGSGDQVSAVAGKVAARHLGTTEDGAALDFFVSGRQSIIIQAKARKANCSHFKEF